MSRNITFVLLLIALAVVSMMLGNQPWGPA
jgi:hypothetical protein